MPSARPSTVRAVALLAGAALWPSCALRLDEHTEQNRTQPVRTRHLFVAGVMGTGLEFFQSLLRQCVESNVCEMRDSSFYTSLMYEDDLEALKKAWSTKRPQSGRLVPMNLLSPNPDRLPDQLFLHPVSGQTLSGNENPKLGLYAKAAEAAGDSFKVLVLTRADERELLAFTMRTLKLSAAEAERATQENVRALAAELRQLPRASFRCQRFEGLLGYSEHMGRMISQPKHESVNAVEFAHQSTSKFSRGCQQRRLSGKAGKTCTEAPMLRSALDELESLCDARDLRSFAAPNAQKHGAASPSSSVALSRGDDSVDDVQSLYADKAQWLLE